MGPFANGGRDYQPYGQPERVRTHDFPDKHLGKICPYGVYDPTQSRLGQCGDRSRHRPICGGIHPAGGGIWARWRIRRPTRSSLRPMAGGNASRKRLWKVELQKLADEIGMAIYVRHFPPGTSKWNKIEHRMFCHITENWRGRPLISHEVVVNLIGHTTDTGLTIQAELDKMPIPPD